MQNEIIKRMHKDGIISSNHLHVALHAPVFDWTPDDIRRDLSLIEQRFVLEKIQTAGTGVPTTSPFPCFRIINKICFDIWFCYPKERKWLLIRYAYPAEDTGPEQIYANYYSWDAGGICEYRCWLDGECVTRKLNGSDGKIRNDVREVMQSCVGTLSYFIFEVMIPGNVILRVEPPMKHGKSVEWRISRTHYLILHRRQAIKIRDTKKSPSEKQILMSAHWRRSHFRRLLSDKFTRRKGQIIKVKQAWIGPDEWIGLDKKIYKVVNI